MDCWWWRWCCWCWCPWCYITGMPNIMEIGKLEIALCIAQHQRKSLKKGVNSSGHRTQSLRKTVREREKKSTKNTVSTCETWWRCKICRASFFPTKHFWFFHYYFFFVIYIYIHISFRFAFQMVRSSANVSCEREDANRMNQKPNANVLQSQQIIFFSLSMRASIQGKCVEHETLVWTRYAYHVLQHTAILYLRRNCRTRKLVPHWMAYTLDSEYIHILNVEWIEWVSSIFDAKPSIASFYTAGKA